MFRGNGLREVRLLLALGAVALAFAAGMAVSGNRSVPVAPPRGELRSNPRGELVAPRRDVPLSAKPSSAVIDDQSPQSSDSAVASSVASAVATPLLSAAMLPGGRLDLNRASMADLEMLPGIGPAKAAAIVDDRDRNGPFRSVGDLERVKGFGPKTVETLSPFLAVPGADSTSPARVASPPGRIRINVANETELQALHGVGPVLAKRIVEHRLRHGPFRGPADLDRVSGVGPVMLDKNRQLIQWD